MTDDLLIEYRVQSASPHTATISLFARGLRHTTLLQLLRIDTGIGTAWSVYAVYREGSMTFEASAALAVARPGDSLESILCGLVVDGEFLSSFLIPIIRHVNGHFTPLRSLTR